MPAGGGGHSASNLSDLGDVTNALAKLPVPVFAVNRDGTITWTNARAQELVGDQQGRSFTAAFAPESRTVAKEAFARKLLGQAEATEYEAVLLRPDGSRVQVEISSVPLDENGEIVGVFGIVAIDEESAPGPPVRSLTPRQEEVLQLLGRGCSTDQMATEMGVSRETVRNHVRDLLHRLKVHSRLEAVVKGRERTRG